MMLLVIKMKSKKQIFMGIGLFLFVVLICVGIFYFAKTMEKNNESQYFVQLSGSEFMEKMENKDSMILVITKNGCSYCELYTPVFKKLVEEYKLVTYYINVSTFNDEEYNYYKSKFTISGTPTTVFIKDGEEGTVSNRIVGNAPEYKILDRLESLGYIEG